LILSRLVKPPVTPGEVISRKRLERQLWDNRSKAVILICASAGSGKTVLLSNYLRMLSNLCWLQCDPLMDNPAVFFQYLTESIALNNTKFGRKTREYIASADVSSGFKSAIDDLVTIFLNDFSENIRENITLVLDDFHLIYGEDEQWLKNVMNTLLMYIPDNLKLIISSREEAGFEISRLKSKRNLISLKTSDLAFTDDEISELLKAAHSKHTDKSTRDQLAKFTSGWITGLHLLIQNPDIILDIDKKPLSGNTDDIFNYFTEDIFNKLIPEHQDFLLATSLFNNFTASDADELLSTKNSSKIINELIRKNIFIEFYLTEPDVTYSYHQLFSAYLRKTLGLRFDIEKLNKLFLKAASVCSAKGHIYDALILYIKAGDFIDSCNLINSSFESYFSQGNYLLIRKWFDAVGWENITKNESLLLNYLKLNIAINDLKISDKCIRYIEEELKIRRDNPNYNKFQLNKAEYLFLSGKYDESIQIIEEQKVLQTNGPVYSELLLLLAKVYFRKGSDFYDIVIDTSKNLLDISIEQNNLKYKIESLRLLGHIYYANGDLLTSSGYYEQTISLEENVLKVFNSFANLVNIYSLTGNYEKAYLTLQHTRKIYEKYPTTLFDRLYNRCAYQYYNNISDYPQAIFFLKKLEANESVKNIAFHKLNYFMILSEIYYSAGSKSAARETFRLINSLKVELDEYYKTVYIFWKHFYCTQDIRSDETEQALLNTLNYHQIHKVNRPVPQFEFHLADYYLQTNNPETAKNYLQKSLGTISAKKYLSNAEQLFVLSRNVFDFAISQNIEKKFIKEIQRRLIDKAELVFISEDFRKRLKEQVKQIIDIKFCSFGVLEFYNRGIPLSEDKWIRKKSKILFAYLMANPKIIHTKDKIMDLFFDDVPPEKADVIYHSTIYNIRTALKIYDLKSDAPKRSKQKQYDYNPDYIVYEDKTIKLNPDFTYESDNIEFEALYNKTKLPAETRENIIKYSEGAMELYKGDFLPGYYENWCEEMRIKYKNMYINICENLIMHLEGEARFDEVIKYTQILLNEDRLNESAHVHKINAYSKLKNINMAKNQFSLMLKIYEEELGEKPLQKTLDKIKSILNV
jgi:DNA-binding SARP family transcriptional activator